jgi:hypothetical protein
MVTKKRVTVITFTITVLVLIIILAVFTNIPNVIASNGNVTDSNGITSFDNSDILSIFAILVSVIVSGITLLLTQFQGPDISLINTPIIKVSVEKTANTVKALIAQSVPPVNIDVKEAVFLFANQGGKAGTILRLSFKFKPNDDFKQFFKEFHHRTGQTTDQPLFTGDDLAVTMPAGDNKAFAVFIDLRLIEWKYKALAEILNPKDKIQSQIEKSELNGRKSFEAFCEYIGRTKTLGSVSCQMDYTKGRFRTKVASKSLGQITVENQTQVGNEYRKLLLIWDRLAPSRVELLNEAKGVIERILSELDHNIKVLNVEVTDANINQRLNNITFQQNEPETYAEKIRWFAIRCEDGLEKKLMDIYDNVNEYNILLNSITAKGVLGNSYDFVRINDDRKMLRDKMSATLGRLLIDYRMRIESYHPNPEA